MVRTCISFTWRRIENSKASLQFSIKNTPECFLHHKRKSKRVVVFSPSRPCRFPFPNSSFKTHKTTLGSQIKRDDDEDDDGECEGNEREH
jgi:hypothetical protein